MRIVDRKTEVEMVTQIQLIFAYYDFSNAPHDGNLVENVFAV
jgi:hypothetical protein